jgi:hypothetical protein
MPPPVRAVAAPNSPMLLIDVLPAGIPVACRAIALRVPIVGAVSVPGGAPLGGMPRSAHRSRIRSGEGHLGLLANIQDCVGHCLRLPVGIGFEVALEFRCCL